VPFNGTEMVFYVLMCRQETTHSPPPLCNSLQWIGSMNMMY